MPEGTPFIKVEHTENFGARSSCRARPWPTPRPRRFAWRQREIVFIPPYDDPLVIAGQGTVAIEMLRSRPRVLTLCWCRSAAAG